MDKAARYDRWRARFEIPVIVAALLVVPVILVEQAEGPTWLMTAAVVVNWMIWVAFAAELVTLSAFTPRGEHLRRHWLDLCIVVTSFPLLGTWLAGTRLLRLVRLGRLFRLLAIAGRGGLAIRRVFRAGGLGYLLLASLLIVLVAGGLFALLEPAAGSSVVDGIWWAVVTLTTVGYGDLYPETVGGRSAAIVLMVAGISFVAILTGSIASYLTGAHHQNQSDDAVLVALTRIESRLDELESRLRPRTPQSIEPDLPTPRDRPIPRSEVEQR